MPETGVSTSLGETLAADRYRLDLAALEIRIFHSVDEAEPVWRAAQEACACHVFQTIEWLSTWQMTLGATGRIEPRIVQIVDADGIALVLLPLGIQRRGGVSCLSFLGGDVTDYQAPLIRADFARRLDAKAFTDLWSRILAALPRVDIVALTKMPAMIADTVNPWVALAEAKPVWSAHAATLGLSFADFKKHRSARIFTDSDRQCRRLSKLGEVSFHVAEIPETAIEIFRLLARQKSRRWQETGSRDLFAEPGYRAFYELLMARHCHSGLAHASAFQVGGTVVATHCGMIFRGRFYYLMPGHEAGDWTKYSVGRLLLQNLVEWSISHGLATFDMTIGDEPYKQQWADHSIPLYDWVYAVTLRGKAYLAGRQALTRLRGWARRHQRLRALMRRLKGAHRGHIT
jgi:CelD/BcsL family acetyltransferase involved in cellulose biosynthesis